MKKIVIGLLVAAIVLVNGYHMFFRSSNYTIPESQLTVVLAPEQTKSMENENFVREDYVSVLPEGTNIASEGKVSSSGFEGTYTERKAVDGKVDGVSYWEGASNAYPNDLTVTFAEARNIHALRVALNPQDIWGKRIQTFSVLMTDEAGEQQILVAEADYEFNPDRGNEVILEFDETSVTSVTLEFTENTGASGGQVAEFELYQ